MPIYSKCRSKTRQQAVDLAKEKSESLAKAAGIHLGSIVSEETQPTQVTPEQNTISTTVILVYQTY